MQIINYNFKIYIKNCKSALQVKKITLRIANLHFKLNIKM